MKFKREDIGLYFALGLVGAGAGLLVGVFVASKLAGPEPIYIPEDDEWDYEPEEITDKITKKISRVKISEEKEEEWPELDDFILEYEPNTVQIAMIKSGVLTMDEVRDAIQKEQMAKAMTPRDYSKVYRDDKPDLEVLVQMPDEPDIIDDRWEISNKMSPNKSERNMKWIYVDLEAEDYFVKTKRGAMVAMGSLKSTISDEAWYLVEKYLVYDLGPIFVNDLHSPKHYRFEALERAEDLSIEDDGAYD